jgi:hypothetical protein
MHDVWGDLSALIVSVVAYAAGRPDLGLPLEDFFDGDRLHGPRAALAVKLLMPAQFKKCSAAMSLGLACRRLSGRGPVCKIHAAGLPRQGRRGGLWLSQKDTFG